MHYDMDELENETLLFEVFMVSNFVSIFFLFSLQTPSESSPEKEQCSRNPR